MAGAKNKLRARCRKSKIDEKTKSLPKGPLVILALEVVSSRSILEVSETTEKLASTKLIPTFPRRQRSHRKIKPKNMTVPDTHQQEGSEILKPLCGRKRKCKQNGKETIEPEVVRPSFGRERPKRRIRDNEINPELGKLDTSAFHCYFEELWKSLPDGKKNSFAYLDCMWFNLYLKPDQQAKVLKWIKKKHIFTKKYVIVPIIRWDHWSLLIICNMGESSQSATSSPCMLLLDSLGKANSKRLEPEIRRFLVDVYKSEERPENKKQIYKIPLMTPTVPQQKNGEDCGSFVLYYIKLFMESAPESFSISESYPYFMTKDWFTQESLADFVGRLKEEGNVIEENLFNENLKKRGMNRNQVHVSDYSPSTEIPSENLEYPPKKRVKDKTKKGKKSSEDHIIHITADDHSHDNIDLISHINCNEGVVLHQENRVKENKPVSSEKENKLSDDLNFEIIHISIEDDSQDIDLFNEINFEVDDVLPPFCSCTGFPKQCYKWGNGGWQSSCCTTTLSIYPLPFSPNNKRHRRIVGRKMSGTVFKRLVNQLVKEGLDLSVPLDLKNYWAKHGSNRYIAVK